MSGQLVIVEYNDIMSFYMVNQAKPEHACEAVNHLTGLKNAHALAPVTAEILDKHEVRPTSPWLYRSMQISTGAVAFSRLEETAL